MHAFCNSRHRWSSLILPESCLGSTFRERLLLTPLAPIALICAGFLVLASRAALHHAILLAENEGSRGALVISKWPRVKCVCQVGEQAVCSAVLSATPLALLTTFVVVPSASASIFQAWSCEAF